jgi:hypothetical protein
MTIEIKIYLLFSYITIFSAVKEDWNENTSQRVWMVLCLLFAPITLPVMVGISLIKNMKGLDKHLTDNPNDREKPTKRKMLLKDCPHVSDSDLTNLLKKILDSSYSNGDEDEWNRFDIIDASRIKQIFKKQFNITVDE